MLALKDPRKLSMKHVGFRSDLLYSSGFHRCFSSTVALNLLVESGMSTSYPYSWGAYS